MFEAPVSMNERAGVPVRWRLFQTAGKIVHNGQQTSRKINAARLDVFAAIRARSTRVTRDRDAAQEISRLRAPHFPALGGRRRAAEWRATRKC
jgi:hypothetical protein